ncbi:hypothetical protein F5884DRAFT_746178 [Xylogone sp. PMI_703]|nr:hypothetical protein F5884DRAFT_746178 [Xylogone sp. PMI_703]
MGSGVQDKAEGKEAKHRFSKFKDLLHRSHPPTVPRSESQKISNELTSGHAPLVPGASLATVNSGNSTSLVPSSENAPDISSNDVQTEPKGSRNTQIPVLAPISDLWNEAYSDLERTDENLVKDYETTILGNVGAAVGSTVTFSGSKLRRKEEMPVVLESKLKEVDKNRWKLKFGSKDIPVADLTASVVGAVYWANGYISDAVNANPYASIAWAGVGLLLPLFLNPSKQAASLAKGLEYISSLIVQSLMREDLYRRRYEVANNPPQGSNRDSEKYLSSHLGYRAALKNLYVQILKFQAASISYYSKNFAFRLGLDIIQWDAWGSMIDNIEIKEKEFNDVNALWKDTKYEEAEALEKRHQESMRNLSSIGGDLSGLRKAIEAVQQDRERSSLLHWLSNIDPSTNYNIARDRREDGTGEWFTANNEEFEQWKQGRNSLLWLHGKAGSGKSILSSSVIKGLSESYDSDPRTAIAYFYFTFSNNEKQKTAGMLESLIKQLCAQRPDTPGPVQDLRRYKDKGQRPDREALEATLEATIHVIDGLDECPYESGERKKLLETIHRIYLYRAENLHLLCTSRKEIDIDKEISPLLNSFTTIAIDLSANKDALEQDLRLYIDKTFASSDYSSWPGSIKEEAKNILINNADGMFLYVSCQFETLSLPGQIRKALRELPKQVSSCLKFLASATTTLRLEQFAEVFIINHEQQPPVDENERLFKDEDVLKYVSGLVLAYTVYKGDWDDGVDSGKDVIYVRFAHFSVQEYLMSERIRESKVANFPFRETKSDEGEEAYYKFPLWGYASMNWIKHLGNVPRKSWSHTVAQKVTEVFAPGAQGLVGMVRIRHPDSYRYSWHMTADRIPPPLYLASSYGFYQVVKELLADGVDVNECSSHGDYANALQAAACHGWEPIVELLLSHNADVNLRGGNYGFALQAAAYRRERSIVNLLLDKGANINLQGGQFGNALQAAVHSRYTGLVIDLLDRGADINVQGGNWENALEAAVDSGHRDIVQILIERGADVNAPGKWYANALAGAVFRGYKIFVELLLDYGAEDIISHTKEKESALQAATDPWRERILHLLLDRGADVNAKGGRYGNALQAAAVNGNSKAIELLIAKGADIHAKGGPYGNALQAAIAKPYSPVVMLLLSKGARLYPLGDEWEELLDSLNRESDNVKNLQEFRKDPAAFLARFGVSLDSANVE